MLDGDLSSLVCIVAVILQQKCRTYWSLRSVLTAMNCSYEVADVCLQPWIEAIKDDCTFPQGEDSKAW